MKFYQLSMIIACLSCNFQADASWTKFVDAVNSKFSSITDEIVHKEFTSAKRLEISNETGSILINSWKQNFIAIEAIVSCSSNMHKQIKVAMESANDTVFIKTLFADDKTKGTIIFNILLPEHIDLALTTKQGDIVIKDVFGALDVKTLQGNVTITNPCTNLKAHTEQGSITIHTHLIQPNHQFEISSTKGDINIYSTPTINVDLQAHAPQGKVTSQIPVSLHSTTTLLNHQAWKHFKQYVHGAIAEPLSRLYIRANQGSIAIMQYF